MGCFVPRLGPPRLGPSSLSSLSSLPLPGSALGLLLCRGGESASESDERTFDGIVLRVALTGVRDRGNEAGRDVDLSRTPVSVVERKVSFSFSRVRKGGDVLAPSSSLLVVESTAARSGAGDGSGLCRVALVTDPSPGPLVSLGGLLTSGLRGICVSWDVRPLPVAESTEGKSSCGFSGWSVMGGELALKAKRADIRRRLVHMRGCEKMFLT